MDYRKIDLDNVLKIAPYLYNQTFRICDYTVGALYMWSDYYNFEYIIDNDCLYIRALIDNKYKYMIPIGINGYKEGLNNLLVSTPNLEFCFVPEEAVGYLKLNKQGFEINPIWFDYVYDIKALINLKGVKYSRQRNHINHFLKNYKDFQYNVITEESIPKLLLFLDEFKLMNHKNNELFDYELKMSKKVLENFFSLGLIGGYLEVDKRIVALSVGEIINDTIYVHIEKANRLIHGSYAIINQQFLKQNYQENIVYVNREEDVGDEGLRKAKQSYRPIKLLQKYNIKIK